MLAKNRNIVSGLFPILHLQERFCSPLSPPLHSNTIPMSCESHFQGNTSQTNNMSKRHWMTLSSPALLRNLCEISKWWTIKGFLNIEHVKIHSFCHLFLHHENLLQFILLAPSSNIVRFWPHGGKLQWLLRMSVLLRMTRCHNRRKEDEALKMEDTQEKYRIWQNKS